MVSWKGTFGFLNLSVPGEIYWNTQNIFLHNSDFVYVSCRVGFHNISNPLFSLPMTRSPEPGMEIEFQLLRHRHRGIWKIKASQAELTGIRYRRIG